MKKEDFTEHPDIKAILSELKKEKINQKIFSDVVDKKGNQYVELVMEGGGVLGVALVGYSYVLEEMGLRFLSLAGTSAGSINALLLAANGNISDKKTENNIEALANQNLYDFVDGGKPSRKLVSAILEEAGKFTLIFRAIMVFKTIKNQLGLNPGNAFLKWLTDILKNNNIRTTQEFLDKTKHLPEGLTIRKGINKTLDGLSPRFAVVTADVTTETKVTFPDMRSLYWKNADAINPANYVRASMSVPYFFEPYIANELPQGAEAQENWRNMVGYNGKVPDKVYFVDGGIMSNFPINIFHKRNSIPRLPTFGARLGVPRDNSNEITNPLNLFSSMFNSIRYLYDYDFILKNPDFKHLIQHIHTGDHNWLNFKLSDEAKIDLFIRGAKAAAQFLHKFDWKAYKQIREDLITSEVKEN